MRKNNKLSTAAAAAAAGITVKSLTLGEKEENTVIKGLNYPKYYHR